jgi:hypothetical protein
LLRDGLPASDERRREIAGNAQSGLKRPTFGASSWSASNSQFAIPYSQFALDFRAWSAFAASVERRRRR